MSALTNYAEELLLKWLLTADAPAAAARPTIWYVALHDGDPGEVGSSNELDGTGFALYARDSVTFADPVVDSGQILSNSQVTWTLAGGDTGVTVTHASVWDALSGGNCLLKGELTAQRVLSGGDAITFEIGEIIATLD